MCASFCTGIFRLFVYLSLATNDNYRKLPVLLVIYGGTESTSVLPMLHDIWFRERLGRIGVCVHYINLYMKRNKRREIIEERIKVEQSIDKNT